jgi:hypothetical protein
MFGYINLNVFLISFAIGLFFIYIMGPDMKKIVVFPTIENSGKVQYQDNSDNCFVYKPTEVKCPSNTSLIHNIPIQI